MKAARVGQTPTSTDTQRPSAVPPRSRPPRPPPTGLVASEEVGGGDVHISMNKFNFFLTYVNGGRREGRRRDDVGRTLREGKRVPDGIAVKSLAQASRTHGRVSPYRATHREGPGKPGDSNLRRPEVREGLTPQPASAGKGLNTHTYGSATLTR